MDRRSRRSRAWLATCEQADRHALQGGRLLTLRDAVELYDLGTGTKLAWARHEVMSIARMPVLVWIVAGGIAMSAIALVGSVTLLLFERTLRKVVLPLVAFAAGSLIGGAFFHMLPAAVRASGDLASSSVYLVLGFAVFSVLEQLLRYHHCHRAAADCRQPLTYLVLIGCRAGRARQRRTSCWSMTSCRRT